MLRKLVRLCLALGFLGLPACKGDPKTPEYWNKTISSAKRTRDRVRVIDDLRESRFANSSFLAALHAQFASEKHSEVKAAYARLLGDLKDRSSVDVLASAIEYGNTDAAAANMDKEIVIALEKIGDPRPIPELIRLLKAKDPYVRIESIQALGQFRAKQAVDALLDLATDETIEPFISKKTVQALGAIGDPRAVPVLVKMMFKERRGVSFYLESSFALFQIGRPAADALVPIAKGEDVPLVRWAKENKIPQAALYAKSAQVLGDLHDDRAQEAFISQLGYHSENDALKLFVRMKAADALGRLRLKAAMKPISSVVDEDEPTARQEYVRALVQIGGREALPALVKASALGPWDAREAAIVGVAMLGDDRERAAFDKFEAAEEVLTRKECEEDKSDECKNQSGLVKKHVDAIREHAKLLIAGKDCKEDAACWSMKLSDGTGEVRQRAAYELGRSGKTQYMGELVKKLREPNLEVRSAVIQAIDWLVTNSRQAATQARASLPNLETQLSEEKTHSEFARVNEDLRRLAVQIARADR